MDRYPSRKGFEMFYHIEWKDMPSGAIGPEAVAVVDPLGIVVIITIVILAVIAIAMYKKLKTQNEIIAEQQDLLEYYYNEDQYK